MNFLFDKRKGKITVFDKGLYSGIKREPSVRMIFIFLIIGIAIAQKYENDFNMKVILIGSEKIDLERKGYNLIESILNIVDDSNSLLIVFGRNCKKLGKINKFDKIYFEEISPNSQDLKILYSACDLFLAPSIQESFGQTVLEAASCCLPSICFENNGISEIIDHKINGYLAKEGDTKDFARGIDWCLQNLKQEDMEKNLKVLKAKFSSEIIAEEYKKFYSTII